MAVIGIVTGQFDIIHPGYISLFRFAKQRCDSLHVLLNVQPENKEPPIFSLLERISLLNAIKYIDEIIPYESEDDLYQFLQNYNPKTTIRFLGQEYYDNDINSFTGCILDIEIEYHPNNKWHYTQVLEKCYEKFLRIKAKDTK